MSKSTYPLKLPTSIKKAAQRLAQEDEVSLNQSIAAAVAEKVGVMETAAQFFKKRAGGMTGAGLMKFVRNAPTLYAGSTVKSFEPQRTLRIRRARGGRS